tara:strand:+ start:37003 stop:37212 length:210 start_codon:yes stop_codon:yes gene_type:complete
MEKSTGNLNKNLFNTRVIDYLGPIQNTMTYLSKNNIALCRINKNKNRRFRYNFTLIVSSTMLQKNTQAS